MVQRPSRVRHLAGRQVLDISFVPGDEIQLCTFRQIRICSLADLWQGHCRAADSFQRLEAACVRFSGGDRLPLSSGYEKWTEGLGTGL